MWWIYPYFTGLLHWHWGGYVIILLQLYICPSACEATMADVDEIARHHTTSNTTKRDPCAILMHDDVIKWKHFPRYWPFVQRIHRSPVNSPHKGQGRGALIFSFDLLMNKRLSKRWRGWWFQTQSRPLWRHCNGIGFNIICKIAIYVFAVHFLTYPYDL